ncbi:hypothetical protein LTR85_006817 [Meristemomyces frigidus]|nr:hypothetical protein LTR85_006817 [Meristemomyces frigidus]
MTGTFLGLPGELRNRIYRLALLSDLAIPVTAQHFQEPTLLYACKQIRHEAVSIYYGENEFDALHVGFDATVQMKMLEKKDKLCDEHKVTLEWFICPVVPRNWSNLLTWLTRAHRGSVLGWKPTPDTAGASEFAIIGELFATCDDLRDLPWERVVGIVERFHRILAGVSGDWAAVNGEDGS